MDLAKLLLDRGAKVHERDRTNDCTAPMHACSSGSLDIVQLLLNRGANLNEYCVTSSGPHTALMFACDQGHLEMNSLAIPRQRCKGERSML